MRGTGRGGRLRDLRLYVGRAGNSWRMRTATRALCMRGGTLHSELLQLREAAACAGSTAGARAPLPCTHATNAAVPIVQPIAGRTHQFPPFTRRVLCHKQHPSICSKRCAPTRSRWSWSRRFRPARRSTAATTQARDSRASKTPLARAGAAADGPAPPQTAAAPCTPTAPSGCCSPASCSPWRPTSSGERPAPAGPSSQCPSRATRRSPLPSPPPPQPPTRATPPPAGPPSRAPQPPGRPATPRGSCGTHLTAFSVRRPPGAAPRPLPPCGASSLQPLTPSTHPHPAACRRHRGSAAAAGGAAAGRRRLHCARLQQRAARGSALAGARRRRDGRREQQQHGLERRGRRGALLGWAARGAAGRLAAGASCALPSAPSPGRLVSRAAPGSRPAFRPRAAAGNVTTDYNGGFASVRSQPWGGWCLLERARGLKMMVRGDGRCYKINAKRCAPPPPPPPPAPLGAVLAVLQGAPGAGPRPPSCGAQLLWPVASTRPRLRDARRRAGPLASSSKPPLPGRPLRRDDQFDGIQYQHDFISPAGEWAEVVLPFERFKPNFRGQVVPGRPPLQGAQVGGRGAGRWHLSRQQGRACTAAPSPSALPGSSQTSSGTLCTAAGRRCGRSAS